MAKKAVNVASKKINPKNFKKMGKIAETEDGGFGSYSEELGGGSPKGGIWGGESGRVGWQERVDKGEVKEGENRQEQPRTADGKFTYNSVNGKETEYDGRGKTVNPLLTGGVNGIKIEDVKTQFKEKTGGLYDKYAHKFVQKGSEKIALEGRKFKTKISKENFFEIASRGYSAETGTFKGEEDAWKSKSGRIGSEEAAAMKEANKGKGEKFVRIRSGDEQSPIKVAGDHSQANADRAAKQVMKSQDLNHSQKVLDDAKKQLAAMGIDVSGYTDEQIDNMLTEQGL